MAIIIIVTHVNINKNGLKPPQESPFPIQHLSALLCVATFMSRSPVPVFTMFLSQVCVPSIILTSDTVITEAHKMFGRAKLF